MPDWGPTRRRGLPRSARQGRVGGRSESRRRGGGAAPSRGREKAHHRRSQEERQDTSATLRRARRQSTTQLYRCGSRILLTKDGYIQGYNAQAAVDAKAQVIVAPRLTTSMSDHRQLVGLIDGIEANLGAKPKKASADSGYLSELNLQALADRETSAYIAAGRAKHPAEGKRKIKEPLTQAMRDKLKRAGWRSRYRLRKQIVEPVFGQIKQARGFRQFLLRASRR
ncbi:transposase [Mesorhizobium sp. M1348]